MIQTVTDTTQRTSSAPATQTSSAGQGKITCHTPFGDVLVDALSTPDLHALMCGTASAGNAGSSAPVTPEATPKAQPAVQPAVQPATHTATQDNVPQPSVYTVPTAQSVFGSNPWVTNPGGVGPGGVSWQYNQIYFATPETAAKVASMFGGKVVEQSAMLGPGPMVQNQLNQMVLMPNGKVVNPGLVASFYTHGYPQSYIDILLQNEKQGA